MAITPLTDATFYNGTYEAVMGAATLPADYINKYLYKASQRIRKYTFGNIDETIAIPDIVQMCVCEVAEKLYEIDTAKNDRQGLKSYSNDGESGTFDDEMTEQAVNNQIASIIYENLSDAGLLYSGGGYAEFKL